jgi:UDP-2,4-diacetamido-2,4,6-trideoxy-beta-L-altropyranose hydrolase
MNILFRADSSSKIGLGHVMRDLVLAKEMERDNHTVSFASRDLDGNMNHKIPYSIEILKTNSSFELLEVIKKLKIDLVVFDHYGIDWRFEKEIRESGEVKVLSFDDTYEKHHCDILLNHNISAKPEKYKSLVPEFCEIRAGGKYTLIREEFVIEKRRTRRQKKTKYPTLFIAMGGADTNNLSLDILKLVPKGFKVNLVTTTANKNLKKLKKFAFLNRWVTLHINSNEIAKIISNSTFAIVTPSVIVHEVFYMQLPFLAIKTADNQYDIYRFLDRNRYPVLKEFSKRLVKLKIMESILHKSQK